MTDWRGLRTPRGALVLAVLAAALAAFASSRAREEQRAAEVDTVSALPAMRPMPFWIGVWVGPPVLAREPETWNRISHALIDVSMGPLEDRYRRADNIARLAFLDTTRALKAHAVRTFVRDDSLHPDETRRPGWQARIAAIVRAYSDSPSLAGYFLADEPRPGDVATWAPLARELHRLDPRHPAFVNFAGVSPGDAAETAARARWRDDVARAVVEGELPLFTVDAYPFGVDGVERPHFLATLQDAAAVSRRTGRPFGVVLQWTGHGDLRAATAGEARYQAMQALVHGASCVIWFTYWTPNPKEEPWRWHGGAVAYDGRPTARLDTLATLNREIRSLAMARGVLPGTFAHFGAGLPAGLRDELPRGVPGVVSVEGGPCTIGLAPDPPGPIESGVVRYVLASRDRARSRTFTVRFDSTIIEVRGYSGSIPYSRDPAGDLWLAPTLEPGGAAMIRVQTTSAARPRTPSPPGTR